MLSLSLTGHSASATQFALGAGDLVEISVMSRPELTRSYRVRLDGAISLHIIGAVAAAGKTPAELEAALEAQFSEIFKSSTSITVEVIRYRSVIVGGQVAAPGAYDYLAGLDVAAAVALAGGVSNAIESDNVSVQMRVETELARYELLRTRLATLLVERARLVAERDGTVEIALPPEAEGILGGSARDMLGLQAALRELRAEQLSLRLEAEDARRVLAVDEAEAYAERRALIRSQVDATMEELGVQQGLAERGLALSQRSLDLRLSADRFRADELEAVALEASAREKISTAEAGRSAATVQQYSEVAQAHSVIDTQIAELRTDIDLARRFVATFGDPSTSATFAGITTRYHIRRRGNDGRVTVIEAEPDTVVMPGDMVEVSLDTPVPVEEGRLRVQVAK